jgi:hypothetical protein
LAERFRPNHVTPIAVSKRGDEAPSARHKKCSAKNPPQNEAALKCPHEAASKSPRYKAPCQEQQQVWQHCYFEGESKKGNSKKRHSRPSMQEISGFGPGHSIRMLPAQNWQPEATIT